MIAVAEGCHDGHISFGIDEAAGIVLACTSTP
jgi:hypothetical protein